MMDFALWFAVAFAAIVGSFILFSVLRWSIMKISGTDKATYFLKHVQYRQIFRSFDDITLLDFILICGFLLANVLWITIGINTNSPSSFLKRTGLVCAINLIPIMLGSHMNPIINICGITSKGYGRIHQWLGIAAIFEGLVHSIFAAASKRPNLQNSTQVAALVAASAMASIMVISFGILPRYFYEIFLKAHLMLAGVLIGAIWVHNPTSKLFDSPTRYLFVAAIVFASAYFIRFVLTLYRSLKHGKGVCRADIIPMRDVVQVHVRLARPWRFRPGQFIYLCIPGARSSAFMQSHPFAVFWWYLIYLCIPGVSYSAFMQSRPFAISWWYRDVAGDDVVVLLIQHKRGFTKDLSTNSSKSVNLTALIEGPYGNEICLESYGTVLLFATGAGIAGQLPYVKQLLDGYHNCQVRTRRIALFWEVESEHHLDWVGTWMTELLSIDTTDYILDIQLFIRGDYLLEETQYGDDWSVGEHGRIHMTCKELDVKRLLISELAMRKGRTIISVCANTATATEIRKTVRDKLEKDICLKELDFRPYMVGDSKIKQRASSNQFGLRRRAAIV